MWLHVLIMYLENPGETMKTSEIVQSDAGRNAARAVLGKRQWPVLRVLWLERNNNLPGERQQAQFLPGTNKTWSFLPLGIPVDFLWSGVSALFSNGRTAGGFFKETASYVQTAKSSDTLSAPVIPIGVPNHSNWLRSNLTRQRSKKPKMRSAQP